MVGMQRSEQELEFIEVTKVGWYVVAGILIMGVVSLIIGAVGNSWYVALGLLILTLCSLYVQYNWRVIKDPKVGLLYEKGRLLGRVRPGWYMLIPVYHQLELESAHSEQNLSFEERYDRELKRGVEPLIALYRAEERKLKEARSPEEKEHVKTVAHDIRTRIHDTGR